MRSELEIRLALKAEIDEEAGFEDDEVMTEAIEELLALRRRLADKKAMAKRILEAWDKGFVGNHDTVDTIIKYLEGADGA